MLDISDKQGCPLSITLFGLYIDELETYLVKLDWDSLWVFNTVLAILCNLGTDQIEITHEYKFFGI